MHSLWANDFIMTSDVFPSRVPDCLIVPVSQEGKSCTVTTVGTNQPTNNPGPPPSFKSPSHNEISIEVFHNAKNAKPSLASWLNTNFGQSWLIHAYVYSG